MRQTRALLGGHAVVDELCAPLADCELADRVRDLLGKDGNEARVEGGEALSREELGKTRGEAGGELNGQPEWSEGMKWARPGYASLRLMRRSGERRRDSSRPDAPSDPRPS